MRHYSNYGNQRQPNHRSVIQQYASEQKLYTLIQQEIRRIKYRRQNLPQYVKELPENHFLLTILNDPKVTRKYSYLQPFVSPNDLMKTYNRKNAKNRFVAVQIFYHYEPTLNNQKLTNISDPQDFFYQVKNKSKQIKNSHIHQRTQNLINAYLNKNKQKLNDTNIYQSQYVVPQGYYPLISVKIKYNFKFGSQFKSGFEYLLLRFDEYGSFKTDIVKKFLTQTQRKQNLKVSIMRKKQIKNSTLKPEQISRMEQLKTVYKIKNVSFGWIETQQTQYQRKSHFQTYFDVITLQNNIRQSKERNSYFSTKNFLFVKKGQFQVPRIEIFSFLFEDLVLKCVIRQSDIKKVDFFNKHQIRQIYLHIDANPKYYFHSLDKNKAFNLYNLGPWERVQNFPIQYQQSLSKSPFMRNFLSSNSVICIDFQTGQKQFEKVVRYFSAQQIISSEFMYEQPFYQTGKLLKNRTLQLENIFNSILNVVKEENKITIHHIKFSLLSLKSLQKTKVTFDDIINLLKQIQNENFQVIEKHNTTLKLLCLTPHQLLSKPFKQVYQKFYKKQEIYKKINEIFPNLSLCHLMKLDEAFEMDSFSEVSDIGSISEFSEAQTEFLENFFSTIQRTRMVLIPRVRLTPNGMVFNGWSKQVASKILKNFREYEYQFLKCQVCDDQGKKIHNSPHILQNYIRKFMSKIKVLDQEYVPLGWSQSQLKQGALWYTLADNSSIKTVSRQEILDFMGNFNDQKLNNPALKAARIGQNFGSSWSFDATGITFIEKEDILVNNNKEKNFSDGIGCISQFNMTHFRENLGLQNLAAIQIRFKGVKGVLSLNKQLPNNTGILRKSMIKYESNHPSSVRYFDIIDYNKYKVGYLNRQIIILLIANKIPQSSIIKMQTEYIQLLQKDIFEVLFENITYDDQEENLFQNEVDKKFQSVTQIFKMVLAQTFQNKNNQIDKLIYQQSFFKALRVEAKRRLLNKLKEKCRIRVEKSVRLFGILDQFKVLNQYEVYCSIIKSSSKQKQNIKGKCMLTKNPCMHPADIRVVNCVSDEQIQKRLKQKGKNPYLFEDLTNVIVFPQNGKTPLTMEISQSDLDGDEFFLSWDQRIVPFKNMDPFVIAEEVPFIDRIWTGSGYQQMLDFYVQFQNHNKLGRLANCHLIQADLKGAFCQQCVQLCKTHSVAVQYPKRGYDFKIDEDLLFHMYPHYMQKDYPTKSFKSKSVLGMLYEAIVKESNIKGSINKKIILENIQKNFWQFYQVYVNMEKIKQTRKEMDKRIQVNKIIEKYEGDQEKILENEDSTGQQNDEPVSYSDVKNEYEIENDQFYKKKKVPFSKGNLYTLSHFLSTSEKSKKYDMDQPYSLVEILTTYNYLSIFYEELKYLSELLESQHESFYTIYLELHTSSKNRNNLFLLEKINGLRQKWLRFFGQELVREGCYSNVEQFENFYFKELIQKEDLKSQKKRLQKINELSQKKKIVDKMMEQVKQSDPDRAQFIMDEFQNLKIVKKSLKYDTYTYKSAEDLNPLIYRKLVLFFMVSSYFKQIVSTYKIDDLVDFDPVYRSSQQGKKLKDFLNYDLSKALKFYQQNRVDFLGFCWFTLPKLMTVWWRSIAQQQLAKIVQKNSSLNQKLISKVQENKKSEAIQKKQSQKDLIIKSIQNAFKKDKQVQFFNTEQNIEKLKVDMNEKPQKNDEKDRIKKIFQKIKQKEKLKNQQIKQKLPNDRKPSQKEIAKQLISKMFQKKAQEQAPKAQNNNELSVKEEKQSVKNLEQKYKHLIDKDKCSIY